MESNMATKQTKPATAPRKPREKAPADESKADRFKRLATKRVGRALKAIAGIGKLGGSSYESTEEQREKITRALTEEVEAAVAALDRSKPATEQFTL
jgi:hypothetical protein